MDMIVNATHNQSNVTCNEETLIEYSDLCLHSPDPPPLDCAPDGRDPLTAMKTGLQVGNIL